MQSACISEMQCKIMPCPSHIVMNTSMTYSARCVEIRSQTTYLPNNKPHNKRPRSCKHKTLVHHCGAYWEVTCLRALKSWINTNIWNIIQYAKRMNALAVMLPWVVEIQNTITIHWDASDLFWGVLSVGSYSSGCNCRLNSEFSWLDMAYQASLKLGW